MSNNADARSAAKENAMSKSKKATPIIPNPATEKARKAALSVVRANLARIDAAGANGSPTMATGAPGATLGAVAGSPVPPATKAKSGKGKGKAAKEPKAQKAAKPAPEKKP